MPSKNDHTLYTFLQRPSANHLAAPPDRFQSRTGPTAGLTFRAKIDLRDTSFIESDHAEGFRIHVDPVVSWFNSPIAVPLGTSAILHLKGQKIVRDRSCLQEITDEQTKSLRAFKYYDPAGMLCREERFMKLLADLMGCRLPIFPHFENRSNDICTPRTTYATESLINCKLTPETKGWSGQKVDMNFLVSSLINALQADRENIFIFSEKNRPPRFLYQ